MKRTAALCLAILLLAAAANAGSCAKKGQTAVSPDVYSNTYQAYPSDGQASSAADLPSQTAQAVQSSGSSWPNAGFTAAAPPTGNTAASLSESAPSVQGPAPAAAVSAISAPAVSDELRAVWISYFELDFTGMTAEQSKAKAESMLTEVKSMGFNTVVMQVRPCADAYYRSEYFPYSGYITGTQGADPGWDPLAFMTEKAHALGLKIHAWVNPYRVSANSDDVSQLAENNPARVWLTDAEMSNNDWAVQYGGGIYFNPAVPEVQRLITDGIREIVQNYGVDGVHIDDYFYPTTDAAFDSAAYSRYTASGGAMPLDDWRRANVSSLMSAIYRAVKSADSSVDFGVSPSGNIESCKSGSYADVELWMSRSGYIDYICPQLYWGFEYPKAEYRFNNIADRWSSLPSHEGLKLYFGLGVYKTGTVDGGSAEWILHDDIIKRQIEYSRGKPGYSGVILFSYGAVTGQDACLERQRSNYLPLFR